MKFDVGIQRRLRERHVRRRRVRLFLYALGAAAVLALFVYIPFFSGLFENKAVSVAGAEVLDPEELRAAVQGMLDTKGNNLLLFSAVAAEERLRGQFPRIVEVMVEKRMFARAVDVRVAERAPAGIVCDGAKSACAYFDANGVVFAEAPFITGASLLMVKENDLPAAALFPYERYTAPMVAFMTDVKRFMRERADITIESFVPINEYGYIDAVTVEGFRIQLTMEQDAETQAQIVKNLLATKIKEDISRLDYIYLRAENRANYKLKE